MRVSLSPAMRHYFKDVWTRTTLISAFFLYFASAALIYSYLPRQDNIVLHYNVYFGIDFLGSWRQAFVIPGVGLALTVLNTIVGGFIWRRDRIISYLFNVGTFFLTVIVTTATVLVIYLNR